MTLSLNVHGRVGGGLVVTVHGELDYATAPQFLACIEQHLPHAGGDLRLDLHLLTFIDSSGVAALVTATRRARQVETRLSFHHPTAPVRRTLQTAGLLDYFGFPAT